MGTDYALKNTWPDVKLKIALFADAMLLSKFTKGGLMKMQIMFGMYIRSDMIHAKNRVNDVY